MLNLFRSRRESFRTSIKRLAARASADRPHARALRLETLEDRRLLFNTYGGDAVWSFTNLSYSFNNLLNGQMTGLSVGQLVPAVEEALGLWSSITPLTFFELPDAGPALTDAGGSFTDYDPNGLPFLRLGQHAIGAGATAHGLRPGDRGQNGDVHFDNTETWSLTPAAPIVGFLNTAAHELGHALGLDHSGDSTALMWTTSQGVPFSGLGSGFLPADDGAGIRFLYGPGLGYVIDLFGALHVFGTGSSDFMTVDVAGGNLTVTSGIVNGPFTGAFTRPLNNGQTVVTSIHVHGQGGDDQIRVENTAGLRTVVHGNAGNDYCEVQYSGRVLDNSLGNIDFFGGAGTDTVVLFDNNNPDPDAYTISNSRVSRPSFGTDFRLNYDGAVENVWLEASSGANDIYVISTSANAKLFIQNQGGADTVYIGSGGALAGILGDIEINNSPSFTTIHINDGANPAFVAPAFDGDSMYSSLIGAAVGDIFWRNSDTSNVNYSTGPAGASIAVRRAFRTLNLSSTGGDDQIIFGNGTDGMQSIVANVAITAANGQPNLTFDDRANAAARTVLVDDVLNGTYQQVSGLAPGAIRYNAARTLLMQLGGGGDTLNVGDSAFGDMTIDGGDGHDVFFLDQFDNWRLDGLAVVTHEVTIDGGAGFNSLVVLDLFRFVTTYTLEPDNFKSSEFLTHAGADFALANISRMDIYGTDAGAILNVLGTPASIGPGEQVTFHGNTGADWINVHPRDASGLPTIHSNIGLLGGDGADSLYIDDSASTSGAGWDIYNPFGAATQDVTVAGGALIGSLGDVENVDLFGSQEADVFNIHSYMNGSTLSVYGDGGDDWLNLTQSSGDLAAWFTSISYFNFDGGLGDDHLNLFNGSAPSSWEYTRDDSHLWALDRFGPYNVGLNHVGVENVQVSGGAGSDRYWLMSAATGSATDFEDQGGGDEYFLGFTTFGGQNDGASMIRGPVSIHDPSGAWTNVDNRNATASQTYHVDAAGAGHVNGDNLFGPGGSLVLGSYTGVLWVMSGTGADTIHATPAVNVELIIHAGLPSGAPGDALTVDLSGVTNPVRTNAAPDEGYYTFGNRQMVRFSGIDTYQTVINDADLDGVNNAIENAAPNGGDGNNDGIPDSQQDNVASLPSTAGNYVTLVSAAAASLADVAALPNPSPADAPAGVAFPLGFLTFEVRQVQPGAATSVALIVPPGVAMDTYWKYGPTPGNPAPHWYSFAFDGTTGAQINGNVVTLNFVDGQRGDDDLTANGTIVDPGAAAATDSSDTVVTNTNDSGAGSLRQAMLNANSQPGADVIVFAIAGGNQHTITPNSGLPDMIDPLVVVVQAGQSVTVGSPATFGWPNLANLTKSGLGTLVLDSAFIRLSIDSLTVNEGTLGLALGGSLVLDVTSFDVDPSATLDLADNDLIVRATPGTRDAVLADITALVASGANALAWTGPGIRSSAAANDPTFLTALGLMLNDNGLGGAFYPSFSGQPVDANSVLVKYTYYGDADLSGTVDGTDYALIDNGFNAGLNGWFNGDFDFTAVVDGTDYALIDNAFNSQGGPLAGSGAAGFGPIPRAASSPPVAGGDGSSWFALPLSDDAVTTDLFDSVSLDNDVLDALTVPSRRVAAADGDGIGKSS